MVFDFQWKTSTKMTLKLSLFSGMTVQIYCKHREARLYLLPSFHKSDSSRLNKHRDKNQEYNTLLITIMQCCMRLSMVLMLELQFRCWKHFYFVQIRSFLILNFFSYFLNMGFFICITLINLIFDGNSAAWCRWEIIVNNLRKFSMKWINLSLV